MGRKTDGERRRKKEAERQTARTHRKRRTTEVERRSGQTEVGEKTGGQRRRKNQVEKKPEKKIDGQNAQKTAGGRGGKEKRTERGRGKTGGQRRREK